MIARMTALVDLNALDNESRCVDDINVGAAAL